MNRFYANDGPLTSKTENFYLHKTIQREYCFVVYFEDSQINGQTLEQLGLRSFHAVSVEIPDYAFEKKESYFGPFVRTTPVLNHNGFEFTIKMELNIK
jgi:hypothetical protein